MYTFDSRIRYSEVDSKRMLTLGSLINYFQDCSTFHSEDIGYGLDYVVSNNKAWILSAWQIEVKRFPVMGEKVKIGTIPYEIKGFLGLRNFWMEDEKGEQIAAANSVWVYMDANKGIPARAPKDMAEAYKMTERLPMNYECRKVDAPKDGMPLEPVTVLKHQIDTNGHLNNGHYIQMALDVLPKEYEGRSVTHMRAEYKKSAMLGDTIIPYISEDNKRTYIDLKSGSGEIFATVEFGF